MLIDLTEYEIKPDKGQLTIYKAGKIEGKGLGDYDSALHAIWTMEGKPEGVTFEDTERGGVIRKTPLKEEK